MTKPRGGAETAVARSYGAKEKGEAELTVYCKAFQQPRSSGLESKLGGTRVRTYVRKFHLKLNIGARPMANKYHEGKVKKTLKKN